MGKKAFAIILAVVVIVNWIGGATLLGHSGRFLTSYIPQVVQIIRVAPNGNDYTAEEFLKELGYDFFNVVTLFIPTWINYFGGTMNGVNPVSFDNAKTTFDKLVHIVQFTIQWIQRQSSNAIHGGIYA